MAETEPKPQTGYICVTCGAQYAPSTEPPTECKICSDPRQYIGLDGQHWTTLEILRVTHANVFVDEEPGVQSIHSEPSFGIGERALLIQTPEGNVLWDCIPLLDSRTIRAVRRLGGIRAIAISHPHYYTTMVEWSRAFKNAPIHVHADDKQWIVRPHENIRFWSGDTLPLFGGLTLIHLPGHFDGFQVLHWRDGAEGRGALFSGDQPQVCPDRRWVSFMYSFPNWIPLGVSAVQRIVRTLDPWPFDRIYGAFPKRTVENNAKERLQASAERYLEAIESSAREATRGEQGRGSHSGSQLRRTPATRLERIK